MLEGAAATVGARSALWGRALATSLGRLAAGSFARRAGDLLQRRGDNRRPFALRRGWRQAVVRSLAAFKAQGGSDGSVEGPSFRARLLQSVSVGGHSAGHGFNDFVAGVPRLESFARPEQICRAAERADPLMLSESRVFAEWQPNGQI